MKAGRLATDSANTQTAISGLNDEKRPENRSFCLPEFQEGQAKRKSTLIRRSRFGNDLLPVHPEREAPRILSCGFRGTEKGRAPFSF